MSNFSFKGILYIPGDSIRGIDLFIPPDSLMWGVQHHGTPAHGSTPKYSRFEGRLAVPSRSVISWTYFILFYHDTLYTYIFHTM